MSLMGDLHRLQEEHGYLRDADLRALAESRRVPLYRLQGLASFYPHFRLTPPPPVTVAVCRDMSCHLAGAEELRRCVDEELDGALRAGRAEVESVSCLGRCDAAPAVTVNETPADAATPAEPAARATAVAAWATDPTTLPPHASAGKTREWHIDPYDAESERYGAARSLIDENSLTDGYFDDTVAARVLDTLKAAGLRGMGGAGFPTATKWELVRGRPEQPHTIIVNADECEPGTFKDRAILDELPHLVVEGALIAGLVAGAGRGIVYIRHEYDRERRALADEIERARRRGVLRGDAAPDAPFDLEIFVSPGGYILGEETALLEALEDRRGEPRNKPPFPVTHGLHGKPTVINNVETLAMVPVILSRGADWWQDRGREGFSGLKLISVSGDVERPGVYEIATGTPIAELIEMAGGVSGGRPVAAVAPGGASSPFLPADRLDTPMDFTALQQVGSMLGSGALLVAAEGTDLLALATNVVTFFRNESCGKCVPCRTGTEKAVAILDDVRKNGGSPAATDLLPQLGETLQLTSICGLGQVALNPILSVMKHFPHLLPGSRNGNG